ncbi:MAG: FG-GAP-like repeat-containing protein [Fimbriiglobus sp.]
MRKSLLPNALLSFLSLEDRVTPAIGGLDPTFATTGKVIEDQAPLGSFNVNDVAETPDGRIVVVGSFSALGSPTEMMVRVYTSAGALDTSFDTDGKAGIRFLPDATANSLANTVVVQPDGKILIAGFTTNSVGANKDFAIARLNPNGTFDTTFDTDGKRIIGFDNGGADSDVINDIALQADGKIVVAGYVQDSATDFDFGVARLNIDGSLDNTFSGDGRQTTFFDLGGTNVDKANAIAIQADGKILVGGVAEAGGAGNNFAIVRYLSTGATDAAFGTSGKLNFDFGTFGHDDTVESIALRPDGRILLAGTWDGGLADFAIAQLKTDGSFDDTFGGGKFAANSGKTNLTFGSGEFGDDEFAKDVVIDPAGRIVVAGYTDNDVASGPNNFAVARMKANGSGLDPTFDVDGRVQVDFGGDDKANAMLQQSDGRIVVVGTSATRLAVARLDAESADIGVTITSPFSQYSPGQAVTYTVTLSHFGTDTAEVVQPLVTLSGLGLTGIAYSSTVKAGTATGNTNGVGLPADLLRMESGSQVVYTITGTLPSTTLPGLFQATATFGAAGFFDPDLSDLSDTESDLIVAPPKLLASGPITGNATLFTPAGGLFGTPANQNLFPTGTARVASGDVNGDGVADIIAAAGPGFTSTLRVLDGKTNAQLVSFDVFEASFKGGLYVTSADMNFDGKAEVIVSPDLQGGPVVAVYDGSKLAAGTSGDAAQIFRFFGIDDGAFRGGARVAVGDVNNDNTPDILVAAGFGGGPRITFWNGSNVLVGSATQLANFFAFEDTLRNGAFITAGDMNGDGIAEVAFGGGPGGAPRVRIFTGNGILSSLPFVNVDTIPAATQIANFFAGPTERRGGVRLAMKDVDADGRADLVTGSGEGEAATARVFRASNILTNANPVADQTLSLFSDAVLLGGVFVG